MSVNKYNFWNDIKLNKEDRKKRKCLGNSTNCKKVVLGTKEIRLCQPCTLNIDRVNNPGKYK